jgi:TolB-like protein
MTADGMSVMEGRKLQEEIQFRLTRDGRLELVSPTTARRYADHPGDVREFASQCGADYVLEGSSWRSEAGFEAVLWVVDGQSGRTSRACRGGSSSVEQLSTELVDQVLGVLIR